MIDEISSDDLKLQNVKGNTAFCFAVMAGNKSIAKKMLEKNRDLLTIRDLGRALLEDEDYNDNELAITYYEHGDRRSSDTLASVGFDSLSSVGPK
ncbi:hypothetical protein Pint_21563 [Pistacia integerrima]|uniref:Uncharacterized protein n=1 Tax=Pistacia integerrima TaxID=434235 RepID=A0ACC0XCY0_9ROSI|nr:hypothetical protein Pint_21563 [Pistacia integerrima]